MTRKSFEHLMRAAGKAVARTARDAAPTTPLPVMLLLDPGELRVLDAWIAARPDPKPTRAQAVKIVLAEALAKM
jgi:hypothetical protein